MGKKRILVCEFYQETNTFNPEIMSIRNFEAMLYAEGQELYDRSCQVPGAYHGMIDAIEAAGGEVIPTIALFTGAGGRVANDVYDLMKRRIRYYVENSGHFDAVFASCHGAVCTEDVDDATGDFLEYLRELVGPSMPIAISCDLHANVTERYLRNTDIICGYQTYPHVDIYETGYRAASLGMRKLFGEKMSMAATILPMLVPPAGYSSATEPFKSVIQYGRSLVEAGELVDFTVFVAQPWLDIPEIGSTVITIAADEETAKRHADTLAGKLFAIREKCRPKLMSIDEVIDRAERDDVAKPVILVDSADSPNAGAVGDGISVAIRLMERGSTIRAGMFVKDPETVRQAFAVGVGNFAEFRVGGKITQGMPGPLTAVGRVRSLHDGFLRPEGPMDTGLLCAVGYAAVLSFGNVDVMVCEMPTETGDPQLLRHFGIEPTMYDLIVVKANASFRVPYSVFASEFCMTDTPGAGMEDLRRFEWKNLPRNMYPFDLAEDYVPEPAQVYRS